MRLLPTRSLSSVLTVCLLALLTGAFAWLTRPHVLAASEVPDHDPDPLNGERLFHAGGCASCHGAGLGGGIEIATAFGTFRVPNISPEPEVGIGSWTTLEFLNAMQRGVSPAGKHYYPAFPYSSYARMSLTDLVDLKSHLDSFPPVHNAVTGHDLALPWSIRRGIGLWKLRYMDDQAMLQVPPDDEVLKRGRYLVEAVGHCGECHTPRDRFGGLLRARWLAGGLSPDGEGSVPNITPHADGLAEWSRRDIERYLGSGFTPDYDMVGGAMTQVQENLARLPDADRAAIAAYLKAVRPLPDQPD